MVFFQLFVIFCINSSSQSGSSSNSSQSPTPSRRRRYSNTRNSSHKSPIRNRHLKQSPTPEIPKRRHSPGKLKSFYLLVKFPII